MALGVIFSCALLMYSALGTSMLKYDKEVLGIKAWN